MKGSNEKSIVRLIKKPDEPEMPSFVFGANVEKYQATDLSYTYTHLKCAEIGALKMIDISTATIRLWYLEFIRLGWNVSMFQSRCEAIKRAKIYGGIDLRLWIEVDMMYSQFELNLAVNERVDSMIKRGATLKRLMAKGFALTDDEVMLSELEAANEYQNKFRARRRDLIEEKKEELKQARYAEVRLKKEILNGLTETAKLEFSYKLEALQIISNAEIPICAEYLSDFADLIPQNLINEFISRTKKGQ